LRFNVFNLLLLDGSSLNVDDQDTQSGVSVITPSNANTSADNRSQVTSGNNTNAPDNIKQTQDPFNRNNHSNQASSEAVNNDPRFLVVL
jgi:hypothetical protein